MHTNPDFDAPDDEAPHPVIPWLTAARRRWLYRVCIALGGLAVVLGLGGELEVAAGLGVVAAVLSSGVALPNVADPSASPAGRIDRATLRLVLGRTVPPETAARVLAELDEVA